MIVKNATSSRHRAARATLAVDSAVFINTLSHAMWTLNLVTLCYVKLCETLKNCLVCAASC